jgi:hypothetical protein
MEHLYKIRYKDSGKFVKITSVLNFEPDTIGHLFDEKTLKDFRFFTCKASELIEIISYVLIPYEIFTPAEFEIYSIDDCAVKR